MLYKVSTLCKQQNDGRQVYIDCGQRQVPTRRFHQKYGFLIGGLRFAVGLRQLYPAGYGMLWTQPLPSYLSKIDVFADARLWWPWCIRYGKKGRINLTAFPGPIPILLEWHSVRHGRYRDILFQIALFSRGNSSSLQPMGRPLTGTHNLFYHLRYEAPPVCLGSLLRRALSGATPIKYSSRKYNSVAFHPWTVLGPRDNVQFC